MSNSLYMALAQVQNCDDEGFPVSGVSFNKYFRNPNFCKEAAKVLQAVQKEYAT